MTDINFWHHGARGDIILGLLFIKTVGGGALYLPSGGAPHAGGPRPSDDRLFESMRAFVARQPYIRHVGLAERFEDVPVPRAEWNWNVVHSAPRRSLLHNHFEYTGVACPGYGAAPWITVEPDAHGIAEPFVVVARTLRYRFRDFDWGRILAKEPRRKVFLGLPEEHEVFVEAFGPIERVEVPDVLAYAQLIAAADDVYSNPTLAMTICQAMGKPHRIENSVPTSASGEPTEFILHG